MRTLILAGFLIVTLLPVPPANGADAEKPGISVPEELLDAWERLQRSLQDWGGQLRERFGGRQSGEERPLISLMLKSKDDLRLSADQVKKLEQLRDNYQRQSIRAEADMRIVELDIAAFTDQPNVELAKVEQKIRELEKMRADLRIARVRAVEQAKSVLTADQRKRFYESLEPRPRGSQNPSAEKEA
jgi:hypothetical protein